ncbi:MAG: hypothetical protein V4805_18435, partial [Pseudomonadota bacterium]
RDILLTAVRQRTRSLLQRLAPEILVLPQEEQIRQLALLCRLSTADLTLALHEPACKAPLEFIRQIQTLQRLSKYYER